MITWPVFPLFLTPHFSHSCSGSRPPRRMSHLLQGTGAKLHNIQRVKAIILIGGTSQGESHGRPRATQLARGRTLDPGGARLPGHTPHGPASLSDAASSRAARRHDVPAAVAQDAAAALSHCGRAPRDAGHSRCCRGQLLSGPLRAACVLGQILALGFYFAVTRSPAEPLEMLSAPRRHWPRFLFLRLGSPSTNTTRPGAGNDGDSAAGRLPRARLCPCRAPRQPRVSQQKCRRAVSELEYGEGDGGTRQQTPRRDTHHARAQAALAHGSRTPTAAAYLGPPPPQLPAGVP